MYIFFQFDKKQQKLAKILKLLQFFRKIDNLAIFSKNKFEIFSKNLIFSIIFQNVSALIQLD